MLAEAAHSLADTLNQVFLMAALKRSQKPADIQHPFGYGMERYFWALLAAVGIFVLGAGYSIYEGIQRDPRAERARPACGSPTRARHRVRVRGHLVDHGHQAAARGGEGGGAGHSSSTYG